MGSTINNLANSGYYQLSNIAGGQSGGTNAGSTAQTNVTQSLIQALSGSSGAGTSGNNDDAYLLNLSPEAQQYLNSAGTTSSAASTSSLASILNGTGNDSSASSIFAGTGNATSASDPLGGSESFTLTAQQQTSINNILAGYKDAPYTQATFDQIQNALNSAGLGTSTLSAEDQAQSFSPTLLLINDLNGGSASGESGMATSQDEQTKSANYMQSIASEWKNMSTTAGSSSASGSAQTATAVTPVSSGGEA